MGFQTQRIIIRQIGNRISGSRTNWTQFSFTISCYFVLEVDELHDIFSKRWVQILGKCYNCESIYLPTYGWLLQHPWKKNSNYFDSYGAFTYINYNTSTSRC